VEIKGLRSVKDSARSDITENVCACKDGCTGKCKNMRIAVFIKVRKASCKMINTFVRFWSNINFINTFS
jgi:hypothetical protein